MARAIFASEIPVISAVGHEPDVTISDYVADMRASTPSNAAEIAVPDQNEMRETLDSLSIRSRQAMQKTLRELSQRLSVYAQKRVLTDPSVYIDNRRLELDHMRERLAAAAERKTAAGRQSFVRLAAALDAMSPLRVLTRGYSLAEDERGGIIKSASQLRPGDRVRLRFAEGGADCTVDSVNKGD